MDGTFSLDAQAANDQYLVVKKGQFMRVTTIDIAEGTQGLASTRTTLPGENDPYLLIQSPLHGPHQSKPFLPQFRKLRLKRSRIAATPSLERI